MVSPGRRWVVGDGKLNMPDGEIMTAPITDAGVVLGKFLGALAFLILAVTLTFVGAGTYRFGERLEIGRG